MSRDDREVILVGGVGGIAPIACRRLAAYYADSTQLGNDLKEVVHNVGPLLAQVLFMVVAFAIAAGVAYYQYDPKDDRQKRLRTAFFAGVTLPGLLVQLASNPGQSTPKRTSSLKANWSSVADSQVAHLHGFRLPENFAPALPSASVTWNYRSDYAAFAANSSENFSLVVEVNCNYCAANPVTIIRAGSIGDLHDVLPAFDDKGTSNTLTVPLDQPTGKAQVLVPSFRSNGGNSVVWNKESVCFPVHAGDLISVRLQLRPGIWNGIRQTLGWPSFYVVDSVAAYKDGRKLDCSRAI